MKSPDKFLIGIVVGIVMLVVIVFATTLSRDAAEYRSDDGPEAAAFNYLLALQNEDYEHAYSYLSPRLRHYPKSLTDFRRDINSSRWQFNSGSSYSLDILSTEIISGDEAIVEISETRFRNGDLFSSSQYTSEFSIYLSLDDGEWKLTESNRYFAYCWTNKNKCN